MVHSFGEGVVSMSTVHDWFKKFKAGHYEVEDKERSGRPSVLNNDELREQVEGILGIIYPCLIPGLFSGLVTICPSHTCFYNRILS
ncbi:unnamed protein product [Nippostrongylus brasiliensis]|uniref:HTH_48 domain-containing protein n=1 Tax=Nippostrongylus brasiliensis TaxID=27835 RepID=A0A0N4YHP9_NIPBR|nr:unnamed protein product [Nippostrongylus brasiliensis]